MQIWVARSIYGSHLATGRPSLDSTGLLLIGNEIVDHSDVVGASPVLVLLATGLTVMIKNIAMIKDIAAKIYLRFSPTMCFFCAFHSLSREFLFCPGFLKYVWLSDVLSTALQDSRQFASNSVLKSIQCLTNVREVKKISFVSIEGLLLLCSVQTWLKTDQSVFLDSSVKWWPFILHA